MTPRLDQSMQPTVPTHVYEVRPRKNHRGVDLISDVLPFGGGRPIFDHSAPSLTGIRLDQF
jgi:hypothetical protein